MLKALVNSLVNGERPLITVDDCRSYMLAWNGAFESFGLPAAVDSSAVIFEEGEQGPVRCVHDLHTLSEKACRTQQLFSEMNVPWSQPGRSIDLEGYDFFPSVNQVLMDVHSLNRKEEVVA